MKGVGVATAFGGWAFLGGCAMALVVHCAQVVVPGLGRGAKLSQGGEAELLMTMGSSAASPMDSISLSVCRSQVWPLYLTGALAVAVAWWLAMRASLHAASTGAHQALCSAK